MRTKNKNKYYIYIDMSNIISLSTEQINGLLLLCGHDASHDFFQSKPSSWSMVQSGGSPGDISSITTMGIEPEMSAEPKKLIRQSTIVEELNELDELNDICDQCGEVSFLDNELNELGNDLNIYEYFSKNIGEMDELIQGQSLEVIDSTESWIYGHMKGNKRNVPELSNLPRIPSSSKRQRNSSTPSMDIVGGSPRIRIQSAIKLKQMAEIKKKKDEVWKEIEQWNSSVTTFIDLDKANKDMNNEMNNNNNKLETYHEMCNKLEDVAKQEFDSTENLEKFKDYRQFRKKYKTLNIERYIKSNWNINMSNPIHETFYEFNLTKKGPTLANNQIKFLNDIHVAMMDLWSRLIYGHIPPTSNDIWIQNQYNSMRKGQSPKTPTDKNLLDKFITTYKEILNEKDTIPISRQLLEITNSADDKKSIINNAAPLQKYCEKDVSNRLFLNKLQYHCVGPSVMDPQSTCPRLPKPAQDFKPNETFTIKDQTETSIKMQYDIIGAKKYVTITITFPTLMNELKPGTSGKVTLTENVPLNTSPICKNLRISEVIQRMIKELKKEDPVDGSNPLTDVNRLNDVKILELMQICLGKLCGDFSQELLAVINIQKKIPTVFVANDGPSSVRFLYMILCLKSGLGPFWGGYMTSQRLLLLTSIKSGIKGSMKKFKRKKTKRKKTKRKKTKRKKTKRK